MLTSNKSRPFRLGRVVLDVEELKEDCDVSNGVVAPESSLSSVSSSVSSPVEEVDTLRRDILDGLWLQESKGSERIGGGDDNGEELSNCAVGLSKSEERFEVLGVKLRGEE